MIRTVIVIAVVLLSTALLDIAPEAEAFPGGTSVEFLGQVDLQGTSNGIAGVTVTIQYQPEG